MDLHLSDAQASTAEKEAVAAVLREHARVSGDEVREHAYFADSGQAARGRRHLLLPALHAVMDERGWISAGALNHVARVLSVPPAEVYGVATFYALFSVEPRAPQVVHVCDDIVCRPHGGEQIAAGRGRARPEGTGANACWRAQPVPRPVRAGARGAAAARRPSGAARAGHGRGGDRRAARPTDRDRRTRPASRTPPSSAPQTGGDRAGLVLLRRVGLVDPASLDDYRAHGGYTALRRAVELGPDPGDRARSPTPRSPAAAGPRSRPGVSGTASRAPPGGRTTWSATPTSPSRARSRTACSWRATRSR